MSHYLIKETQLVSVEYLVRADSLVEAKAKAKTIDTDVVELVSHPTFIETVKYTGNLVKKDEEDPVVVSAIKKVEANYAPIEPDPPKKRVKRKGAKTKKEKSKSLLELVEKRNNESK